MILLHGENTMTLLRMPCLHNNKTAFIVATQLTKCIVIIITSSVAIRNFAVMR